MNNTIMNRWMLSFSAIVLLCVVACKKEPIISVVSDQVNITGYIENNPDQFSEFKKILDLTGNSGYLQAYGNYTLFLPNNDGVKKYLTDMGKTSVEQVDLQELKDIVRFHLLEDTIATTDFSDGKLSTLTMFGQYLITGASNVGGETKITVNRQANVEEQNIRLGNGYVHVIDNVLRPAKLTLAQMIEVNPNLQWFTAALKETGLYDTLNYLPTAHPDSRKKFLTVIAESDQVLQANFANYNAFKAKYNTGSTDLKSHLNGFHAFMAYHILFDARYFADIASSQGHPTLAEPEVISSQLKNEQILINDVTFNGTYEPGFLLSRQVSDVTATNGVLHFSAPYTPPGGLATTGHFAIKKREPFPVYWDVADFPESRALTAIFRKTGSFAFDKATTTSPSPIKGWDWGKQRFGVTYRNDANNWVFGDYLNLVVGVSSRNDWMTFKTPLIVRGRYSVWVCYRRQNQSGSWPARIGTRCRMLIDGEALPKVWSFAEPAPTGSTAELEALGWKYYTSNGNAAAPFLKQTYNAQGTVTNSPWVSKNLGVIDIKTTDIHTMTIEAILDSQNANNLDMVHFIPVDYVSQILPRFKVDGSEDWTNYPGTH